MKLPIVSGTKTEIDQTATAQLVRDMRKKRKMKQKTLAYRMGYTSAYLSDLENGRRAWSEVLFKKAAAVLA